MNQIRFIVEPPREKWQHSGVRVLVDGEDLASLARHTELPFAIAEGHPDIAGGYGGLAPQDVLPPSRHLLGEPDPLFRHGERVEVLCCQSCGEPGCWPLACRITVTPATITWSDFTQPHRGPDSRYSWRHDSLGPFVFARGQYEEALHTALLRDA